jgi:hypothetical protein
MKKHFAPRAELQDATSGRALARLPNYPASPAEFRDLPCYRWRMQPLKAHVRKGRLVLDEPTDLPEGEEVELVPLDELLARGGDYLDEDERQRLHDSLHESIEQMKRGETIDAATAMAELRAHR